MFNNFLSHIIRDLFNKTEFTVIYGKDISLRKTLANNEHSIGAYVLHTERGDLNLPDYCYYWEAGINHPFFSPNSCDLFVSINYDPQLTGNYFGNLALQLVSLLKINGLIFLLNPGDWASALDSYFLLRTDLITEAKRYKILEDETVLIYENI